MFNEETESNEPAKEWIRTCQECGHKDVKLLFHSPVPSDPKAFNKYCEKQCKKCKSESLDYGSFKNKKD